MIGKFEAVLDAQLRGPRPEIARVGERRNDQRRKRSWSLRRKEQAFLPGDQGGVLPIQANGRSTQSHHTGVHAIVSGGKSAAEIEIDVAAGVGPEDFWPKDLEAEDRLPKRASHRARRVHGIGFEPPRGDVLIVRIAAIAEQVEEHDARKAHPVFGSALQLGLILLVHLVGEQLLVFGKLIHAMLQLGSARRRNCRRGFVERRLSAGYRAGYRAACAVLRFEFLAQLGDLSAAGHGLLLQLQHHFLQFADLGLKFSQGCVHAGVVPSRGVGWSCLGGTRHSYHQGESHQQHRTRNLQTPGEFHVTPRATSFECPDTCGSRPACLDSERLRGVRGPAIPRDDLLAYPRQHDLHYGAPRYRAFQFQGAVMVLHDLLRDRKTQSCAVLLAVADEWLKQLVTERGFYSGTIVGGADFQVAIDLSHVYRDVAAANLGSLAAIQQQIVEDTLHLTRIELRAVQPRRFNTD